MSFRSPIYLYVYFSRASRYRNVSLLLYTLKRDMMVFYIIVLMIVDFAFIWNSVK